MAFFNLYFLNLYFLIEVVTGSYESSFHYQYKCSNPYFSRISHALQVVILLASEFGAFKATQLYEALQSLYQVSPPPLQAVQPQINPPPGRSDSRLILTLFITSPTLSGAYVVPFAPTPVSSSTECLRLSCRVWVFHRKKPLLLMDAGR